MTKMNIFYYLIVVSVILWVGMIGLGFYWQYVPYNQDDYFVASTPKNLILNPDHVVHQGEVIKWSVNTMIKRPFVAITTRYIESEQPGCDFKILPTTTIVAEVGPKVYTNTSYIVPLDFKPCTYHVKLVSAVKVNPNRTVEFIRYTEDFTVIK